MNGGIPTPEQILNSLIEITNTWWVLAVVWHFYFAILIIILAFGVKLKINHWLVSKRMIGFFLGVPILSISIISWLSFNPFNGIVFSLVSILIVLISIKLSSKKVQVAPLWAIVLGSFLVIFGWIYPSPHFIDISSFLAYLYAAPLGLIPCPTLLILIGLTFIFNNLGSRKISLIFGIIGITYGIMGIFQLGILIDWVLLFSAVMIIINTFLKLKNKER